MARQQIAGAHGGYRKPGNPAAVSGPGGLAKRTDGTPAIGSAGGEDYGEAQALKDLQRAAPTQTRSAGGNPGAVGAAVATPPPTGFDAPGDDTPVTSGAALGEGPGPEVLGLDPDEETRGISEGMMQLMLAAAQRPNASPSFRRLVRRGLAARM